MKIAFYGSDLTDAQWALLEPMLPKRKKRGRPPTDSRQVINAILYIVKGGIQWRLLPHNFPPWKTVYHIFRKWSLNATWAAINDRLRWLASLYWQAKPSVKLFGRRSILPEGARGATSL